MEESMTPRQARVALGTFVLLTAGVVYNALYMQDESGPGRRVAADATQKPARADAPPPGRSRTGQATKRTALLKPDAVRTAQTPESLADEAGVDTIRAIQRELNQRGFGPVGNDGLMRPVTRAAIMSYEHDNRLPLTGEATEALLARLVLGAPATDAPSGAGEVRSPHAEATIKQVQRLLAANGYRPGTSPGQLDAATVAAIRAFEKDQGLSPKGRISAEIVARLQSSGARLKSAEAR
jgi:peptidoglycan hydrolase-like protein with peptidoglycan-binding domain